jgi:hypothetical protein
MSLQTLAESSRVITPPGASTASKKLVVEGG